MNDIPYELMHLPKTLHDIFDGLVPQAKSGTNEQKEANFLTRALAAFAIQKITGCEKNVAAESVVDSGNDGGVDAAYFSESTNTLWLVQSKYDQSGRGQPDLQGITRFKTGLEQILSDDFTEIEKSEGWKPKLADLKRWLSKSGLQIKIIVVYSGIAILSDDRIKLFEHLKRQFNNDDNFIEFKSYGLTSIHDWITGRDKRVGVEKVDLEILNPGWFKAPHETIYGKIKFSSLVKLIHDYGDALVAANIRRYKGRSDVNEQITRTVTTEPENLFYLNNGLTAYCTRLEVSNVDRNNSTKKRISAHGFCIVNGAQTLGSIGDAYKGIDNIPENGEVFIKIVSLERCEDEREFAKRITESTNRQNQISAKDFISTEDIHERIAAQLALADINYHYKDGEDIPNLDDNNFTIDHATVALACLNQDREFNLLTRIRTDRKSLWSLEIDSVYPEIELVRSRYGRVFKEDYSARTVWRAVQTYRIVWETMKNEMRTATGVQKSFYENCRGLVLKIIFLKHRPECGEELAINEASKTQIVAESQEVGVAMWAVYEQLGFGTGNPTARSVFSNSEDCRRLFRGTMARLASNVLTVANN